MKWNLRLAAAHRGIWTASEMQRMLAARGLTVSAGKMSGLWSGSPASVKLSELDVICAVLGCGIGELLLPEPGKVARPDDGGTAPAGRRAGLRRAGGHAQAPRRPHPAAALRWADPGTRPATGPAAAPTAWPGE